MFCLKEKDKNFIVNKKALEISQNRALNVDKRKKINKFYTVVIKA
jgi:hypothetical protein